MNSNNELYTAINNKLTKYALIIPPYATGRDVLEINELLVTEANVEDIESKILSLVMLPRVRAGFFKQRLSLVPDFKEFHYLVDYSYLAFCRGNKPGSLFVIVPIIEGMLRRWVHSVGQEVPERPKGGVHQWLKEFVLLTLERQKNHPSFRINIIASRARACADILEKHFYKSSNSTSNHEYFNRHTMLHHLKPSDYMDANKVKRTYLLMDLITELYLEEKRIMCSIFYDIDDSDPRFLAYYAAITNRFQHTPEDCINTLYKI